MKTAVIFLTLLLVAGMLGCGRQQQPRHIVILIDVSGSIDRESLEQTFKAIDELVGHLQRGDRITVIPILGDAQADASGRIIRWEVPRERRAYDADLRAFGRKLSASLGKMRGSAMAHPGSQTDILGSVALAKQELQARPTGVKQLLIIMSDFIQEDRVIDFKRDERLANSSVARKFALKISSETENPLTEAVNLNGVPVYLGLLRSIENIKLPRQRASAIQEFWVQYFKGSGSRPQFVLDGLGQLEDWCDHTI